MAFDELFEQVCLDGGDKPFLSGVGSEGWTKRLEACSSVVREWFVVAQVGRGAVVWGEESVCIWGLSACNKSWEGRTAKLATGQQDAAPPSR